jgi:hypothetical protein
MISCDVTRILIGCENFMCWFLNWKLTDLERKYGVLFLKMNYFFFLDFEQSYLGSYLVLNHPSSVSTLYFQVATFQKRATLAESPPIPTTQQVPDRRPRRRTSDLKVIPELPRFRVVSFATPHYVIYRLIVPQADAQEVLHNVYSPKLAPQARGHHPFHRTSVAIKTPKPRY